MATAKLPVKTILAEKKMFRLIAPDGRAISIPPSNLWGLRWLNLKAVGAGDQIFEFDAKTQMIHSKKLHGMAIDAPVHLFSEAQLFSAQSGAKPNRQWLIQPDGVDPSRASIQNLRYSTYLSVDKSGKSNAVLLTKTAGTLWTFAVVEAAADSKSEGSAATPIQGGSGGSAAAGKGNGGPAPDDDDDVHAFMERSFAQVIGMTEVKEQLAAMIDSVEAGRIRKAAGHNDTKPVRHHMLFLGPPGTGKTTVGKLVSQVLQKLGLANGKFLHIEKPRLALVGTFVGETAPKASAKFAEAQNGVVLIDDAPQLMPSDSKVDYGKEALQVLISETMPADEKAARTNFIMCGYEKPMKTMLEADKGLESRFPKSNWFTFKPYSMQQLIQIFAIQAERFSEDVTPDVDDKALEGLLSKVPLEVREDQNGRMIENIVIAASQWRDKRVMSAHRKAKTQATANELHTLTLADIEAAVAAYKPPQKD